MNQSRRRSPGESTLEMETDGTYGQRESSSPGRDCMGNRENQPMTSSEIQAGLPPFRPGRRSSGVLMHVTSLPSPYGVGDVGPAAYAWVDRLHDAGQRWWQALPLGPTGCGNSPYSALSSFAGNSLLVSPDLLIEDGLLDLRDC